MYWKIYAYFKELEGMNAYIDKHDSNLMSERSFRSFLKAYLDKSFSVSLVEPFKIFDFVDGYSSDNCEFYEQMLINSKYLNSMPGKQVINALFELTNGYLDQKMPDLPKFLISKVEPFRLLELSDTDVSYLYESYSGFGIEKIILGLGTDFVIGISEELEYQDQEEFLKYCKIKVSREDFKRMCIEGSFAVVNIFNAVLEKYDEEEFDILFEVMMDKKHDRFSGFLQVLNASKIVNQKDKNYLIFYLASKLLETEDYPKMLIWITNIECETNKAMIDKLVGKIPEFILLYNVSDKYVPYVISKLLEQGEINSMGIPVVEAMFLGIHGIDRINLILDNLFILKPDVKFSKNTAINLLKMGVNKFSTLINDYELSEEEREEILESLREINSDWLIIYGAYLVSGDGFTKMLDYVADEQMRRIRNLKSSSEEM